jgi:hypothetical protein
VVANLTVHVISRRPTFPFIRPPTASTPIVFDSNTDYYMMLLTNDQPFHSAHFVRRASLPYLSTSRRLSLLLSVPELVAMSPPTPQQSQQREHRISASKSGGTHRVNALRIGGEKVMTVADDASAIESIQQIIDSRMEEVCAGMCMTAHR